MPGDNRHAINLLQNAISNITARPNAQQLFSLEAAHNRLANLHSYITSPDQDPEYWWVLPGEEPSKQFTLLNNNNARTHRELADYYGSLLKGAHPGDIALALQNSKSSLESSKQQLINAPTKFSERAYGLAIKDGKVLLAPSSNKNSKGQSVWWLPGGGQDPGETLEQALKREIKEETGLDAQVGDKLGEYSYLRSSINGNLDDRKFHVYNMNVNDADIIPENDPSASTGPVEWKPLNNLSGLLLAPYTRDAINKRGGR